MLYTPWTVTCGSTDVVHTGSTDVVHTVHRYVWQYWIFKTRLHIQLGVQSMITIVLKKQNILLL